MRLVPSAAALCFALAFGVAPAAAAPKPEAVAAHQKGSGLFKQKRLQEAVVALEEATRLDPSYAKAWSDLGNVHLDLKNLSGAVRSYENALRADPELQIARYNLAFALSKTGDFARAAQQYRTYLQRSPEDADALYALGDALRSAGEHLAAADAYDRYAAAEKRPNLQKWVAKARETAAELRKKAQPKTPPPAVAATPAPTPPPAAPAPAAPAPAVATQSSPVKATPDQTPQDAGMHLSFSSSGPTPPKPEAPATDAAALDVPVEEGTAPPRTHRRPEAFHAGLIELQNHAFESALTRLRVALADAPDDPLVLAALGSAHLGLRDGVQAEQAYQKALAKARADALPGIYLGLGEALRLQHEDGRALEMFRQAAAHPEASSSVRRASEERISALQP